MCFICQAVGRDVFADQPDVDHDPDDLGDGMDVNLDPPLYYVWRRSDGMVMTTNMHPEEIFDETYGYHIVSVDTDADVAAWHASWAVSCN